jgi:hypothetical protein
VVTVEPFYEGTLATVVTTALRHVPARFDTIGVPRRFPSAYGTAAEHDRDNGLDAAGIRARLEALLAETSTAPPRREPGKLMRPSP